MAFDLLEKNVYNVNEMHEKLPMAMEKAVAANSLIEKGLDGHLTTK